MLRALSAIATLLTFAREADISRYLSEISSLELFQSFTLIHDDLPSLDNSPLRRGVESVHRKFGEAVALLAGDMLFGLAFRAISNGGSTPAQREKLTEELSRAASEVIQGQALELEFSGVEADFTDVEKIIRMKTASLFIASFRFGAILADTDQSVFETISALSERVGLAYQAKDDLLSVVGAVDFVGKSLASDAILGRPTLVSVLGVRATEDYFEEKMREANRYLQELGPQAMLLKSLVTILYERRK